MVRLQGNESIEEEGAAADLVAAQADALSFADASVVTTGAPVLLQGDQRLPARRHADARRHRGRDHGRDPARAVRRALAAPAAARDPHRCRSGRSASPAISGSRSRSSRSPACPSCSASASTTRSRCTRTSRRKPILDRAEHPIQETARNLGPALLVVTFDAIFAFLALRFAKVPMIRDFGLLLAVGIAAICLCSIMLPLADPRHPRAPLADDGQGLPRGPARTTGRVPRAGAARPRRSRSRSPASCIFFWGIAVEDDLTLQTDPGPVGEPGLAGHQGPRDRRGGDQLDAPSSASSCRATTSSPTSSSSFVHGFTRDQLAEHDGDAAHRVEHRDRGRRPDRGSGRLRHPADRSNDVRAAFDVAPDDLQASTVSPDESDFNIVFRAGPSSLEERAPIVQEIRDDTTTAGGHRAHAVGPRGRRRRAAREPRGEPGVAHLPRDAVRVPVPRGAAPLDRPLAAVARPRRDRGRARVDRRVGVRPEAEPDDRRRRPARDRSVHGVHLADPAALRRGTRARLRATRGDRRDRVAHRPRVHRLGAHRHRRRRGALVLVAPAAPRLRPHRRDERRGRAAERARGAAADAGVGRTSQPRVTRADQGAAAVRRRAAGPLPGAVAAAGGS